MRAMQVYQTASITADHPLLQLMDVPIPMPQALIELKTDQTKGTKVLKIV